MGIFATVTKAIIKAINNPKKTAKIESFNVTPLYFNIVGISLIIKLKSNVTISPISQFLLYQY